MLMRYKYMNFEAMHDGINAVFSGRDVGGKNQAGVLCAQEIILSLIFDEALTVKELIASNIGVKFLFVFFLTHLRLKMLRKNFHGHQFKVGLNAVSIIPLQVIQPRRRKIVIDDAL